MIEATASDTMETVEDFRARARAWLAESMPPLGDGWNDRSDEDRKSVV